MQNVDFIGILCCILAVSNAMAGFIGTYLSSRIRPDLFSDIVVKLVSAGHLDRAIKLCGAAPNALFVKGVFSLLNAAQAGERNRASLENAFDAAYAPPADKPDARKSYVAEEAGTSRKAGLDKVLGRDLRKAALAVVLALTTWGLGWYRVNLSAFDDPLALKFMPFIYWYVPAGALVLAVVTLPGLLKFKSRARASLPRILDVVERLPYENLR